MATVEDLRAVIYQAATPIIASEVDTFGRAVAQAMAAAAPVRTGTLRASVRWVATGPFSGEFHMVDYAVPVNFGHRVRGRPRTSQGYVPANPFLQRGVASAALPLPPDHTAALKAALLAAIATLRGTP